MTAADRARYHRATAVYPPGPPEGRRFDRVKTWAKPGLELKLPHGVTLYALLPLGSVMHGSMLSFAYMGAHWQSRSTDRISDAKFYDTMHGLFGDR